MKLKIPREIVLVPIVMLWVLLVWQAKVEHAIQHGDTYLMPGEMRNKIVWYFGYGPVIVQGLLILLHYANAERREASSPIQPIHDTDAPGP